MNCGICHDNAIISIHRKCEVCLEIYDATEEDLAATNATANATANATSNAVCKECKMISSSVSYIEGERDLTVLQDQLDTEKPKKKSLKTLPSSGYSSLLPYQIPQVRTVLLDIFGSTPPSKIVDTSAHIGGDTIHFAKIWPNCKIISIDIDENAVKCLKSNVAFFAPHPENIEIICGDSTKWIRGTCRSPGTEWIRQRTEGDDRNVVENKKADFYYFDPPWGGPDYCSENEISLFLSGIPIAEIINFVLDNKLASKVLLKAPRNFSYHIFKKEIHGLTKLFYIRKPQKKGSIAYSLIFIQT